MNFDYLMKKITRWLDSKLDKYREKEQKDEALPVAPKTEKELVELIKKTPAKVLSAKEKNMIAMAMSFSEQRVYDLMIKKDEVIFVGEDEVLGPLMLDKLYKSGLMHFPVVDKMRKIVGVINTEALNSLEIKEAKKAKDLLIDKKVVYVRYDKSLMEIVDEFLRSNTLFYAVVDEKEKLVGVVTFEMVIYYLFGKI